jgi:hypothetical protein
MLTFDHLLLKVGQTSFDNHVGQLGLFLEQLDKWSSSFLTVLLRKAPAKKAAALFDFLDRKTCCLYCG